MNTLPLTTPLRDLLTIPERVDAADFVLKLHEGVAQAERTLGDYVVTDAIAESLDEALGLVERTIAGGQAKGSFIHGSFGSGKSHFMAVLHLLLTGNIAARQLPGLQSVVDRRAGVLGRKLLALDYHLLGAESFEQALFKGYLDTVAQKHPESPLPVLHASEGLFDDAVNLRTKLGDDAFFTAINDGADDDGWGDFAGTWDAATFEAALRTPSGHPERSALAQSLMSTLFTGYRQSGEWLDISDGLTAMTAHARDLGYDGIVLFLDELVLWLGQHLSDMTFITSETSKVAKLVETGMSSMPIPLISFVARQRDLKDFLGGSNVGAEQEALGQSFQWWEDRFEKIELRSADLPKIVKQRLLTPVSAEAADVIRRALAAVKADSSSTWSYLLTDEAGANEGDFADVYPFSPALVDAMVALSSLMQRDRTALKLMGELLATGRQELTASDVIPVGDLFAPVVLGSMKPLTDDMKRHFDVAATFYRDKMRPYLLGKHRLDEKQAGDLPRSHQFRTEDRLVKTLLIAGLVPETASLRNLTASRLAALNYGTINAYIPGQEAQQVVTWAKEWAQHFGEVSLSEGADPIIALRLAGVDYTSILDRVQAEDSVGNRRSLIRQLITEELGLEGSGLLPEKTLTQVWRGHKQEVSVIFGNVRDENEVRDDDLFAPPGMWRLVIDFPYDDDTHSPNDDVNRVLELGGRGVESTTIAWIPNFLHRDRLDDIGKLVMLEHVLKPTQFEQNAGHLAVADREPARQTLENQRKNLRERVKEVLRQAYGVSAAKANDVDVQLQPHDIFSTLYRGLTIQPPVAVRLSDGLRSVLDQAWSAEHPDHPKFEPGDTELKSAEVRTALEQIARAHETGGRVQGLDAGAQRALKRVAVPLQIGTLRENVYSVSLANFSWSSDLTKATAATPDGVTVGQLRSVLAATGMSTVMEDAVILAWSIVGEREWVRGTATVDAPQPGQLTSDLITRPANLPTEDDWNVAVARAEVLFGIAREPNRTSGAVRRLGRALIGEAERGLPEVQALAGELQKHAGALGIDISAPSGRLATAQRAREVLTEIAKESDPRIAIEVLASLQLPAEANHLAKSITTSGSVQRAVRGVAWSAVEAVGSAGDPVVDAAIAALKEAAAHDELHSPLLPVLEKASTAASQFLIDNVKQSPAPTPPVIPLPAPQPDPEPDPVEPTPPVGVDDIELDIDSVGAELTGIAERINTALKANPGKKVRVRWWLE